jgi:hypothetical protein
MFQAIEMYRQFRPHRGQARSYRSVIWRSFLRVPQNL